MTAKGKTLRSSDHARDWTPEQIAEWKRAYSVGEPVLLPHLEHEAGECDHCDLLRKWMQEADDAE